MIIRRWQMVHEPTGTVMRLFFSRTSADQRVEFLNLCAQALNMKGRVRVERREKEAS